MRLALPWLCLFVLLKGVDHPELSARDVVRAADHFAGSVAPGEIVVLFPSNAGPDVLAEAQRDSEGKVATLLGETRVWFDGIAAPVVYSVRGQVSAVVPYEISNKRTTQVVVEYQGVRSLPVTLPVVDSAPAVFTLDSSGRGQAAMLNETVCCNSARNPAPRGSITVLYATGEGQTNPPGITGKVSAYARIADYPAPHRTVRVTIGGEPARILYAGEAPHSVAGLLQVNFRVPAKAPLGDAVPIVLTVGDSRSPDGVTMAVRSAVQRILVMNHEAVTRNWLRKVLADAGYEVLTARDEHPVDLVISSLTMLEEAQRRVAAALNGTDCRPPSSCGGDLGVLEIRADRPQLKIIATAGALSPDTLRSADLLGAQAVLAKPLTSQSVLQRVRELLRSRPVPYVAGAAVPPFPLNRNTPR